MSRMFLKSILLIFLGLCSGVAVSAGTFAFILVIGVVPRMLRAADLMDKVILIETVIVLGVVSGNIMSLWDGIPYADDLEMYARQMGSRMGEKLPVILQGIGHMGLTVYGLSAGVFVGCIAVALAEILDTFPIMFRRMKLSWELGEKVTGEKTSTWQSLPVEWMLFAMAFGKLCGSLFSFLGGYRF